MTAFDDLPADAANCYAWAEEQCEVNPASAAGAFDIAQTFAWIVGIAMEQGEPMPAEFVAKRRLELVHEGQACC